MPAKQSTDRQADAPLTKSLVAAFEQCPRRLWLQLFAQKPAMPGSAQQRLLSSQQVGTLARSLVGGHYVAATQLDQALAKTAELIAQANSAIF